MRSVRLYSGWMATVALLLFAWLAFQPMQTPESEKRETEASPSVLQGKTILIDPGHGGTNRAFGDYGAEGVGPAPEKENVLQVALHLERLLREAGAHVVMTRTEDVNPATGTVYESLPTGQLLARVDIAQRVGGDVLVSIHNDANNDPRVMGSTTYYYHEQSRSLAEHLQRQVVSARGSRDLGVKRKGFKVILDVAMPAALIEVGFVTNPDEAKRLADPTEQKLVANALYNGLEAYFTQVKSG